MIRQVILRKINILLKGTNFCKKYYRYCIQVLKIQAYESTSIKVWMIRIKQASEIKVLKGSGHVANFSFPVIECTIKKKKRVWSCWYCAQGKRRWCCIPDTTCVSSDMVLDAAGNPY